MLQQWSLNDDPDAGSHAGSGAALGGNDRRTGAGTGGAAGVGPVPPQLSWHGAAACRLVPPRTLGFPESVKFARHPAPLHGNRGNTPWLFCNVLQAAPSCYKELIFKKEIRGDFAFFIASVPPLFWMLIAWAALLPRFGAVAWLMQMIG